MEGQEGDATTVVRGGALGDFVVTLPALSALAADGPLRLIGNRAAALALAPALFAAVEAIDDRRWGGLFADELVLPRLSGAAVAIVGDGRVAERLRRAGCDPVRAVRPFPSQELARHVADHLLAAVAPGAPLPARPRLTASAAARAAARARLAGLGLSGDYAVVHPGSGSPRKNWSTAGFAAVATWLRGQGRSIVLLGGEADERPLAALTRALAASGLGGLAVVAAAPLAEVAALLAGASLYVGNDSGISHVAAAVGAPTVAVFGPTRALRWAPRGRMVAVVEPPARCLACAAAEERPAECACLERVLPEQVVAAARLLAR